MIKDCYEPVGEDIILSDACDLFEKDVNKLLWNELNFFELVVFNKDKYTFVYERMPEDIFNKIMQQLQIMNSEISDLIEEVNAHRDVMVVRIKEHVDDRTHHIVEESRAFAQNPEPTMNTYNIEIKQTISDPTLSFTHLNLPKNIKLDQNPKNLFKGERNRYQEIANEIEHQGTKKLKNLYGGMRNEEVFYDPDRMPEEESMHKHHQKQVLEDMFSSSLALNKDETENPNDFIEHQENTSNSIQTDFMKKRKLREYQRKMNSIKHKQQYHYRQTPQQHKWGNQKHHFHSHIYRNMV